MRIKLEMLFDTQKPKSERISRVEAKHDDLTFLHQFGPEIEEKGIEIVETKEKFVA